MTTSNPAKQSLKQEQQRQAKSAERAKGSQGDDAELNKALEDTFPASDPVAAQSATKPGARKTQPH